MDNKTPELVCDFPMPIADEHDSRGIETYMDTHLKMDCFVACPNTEPYNYTTAQHLVYSIQTDHSYGRREVTH